jgi:hypothetical protein
VLFLHADTNLGLGGQGLVGNSDLFGVDLLGRIRVELGLVRVGVLGVGL